MPDRDAIQCTCGCEYFEQIQVSKFPKMHSVIVGQQLQPLTVVPIIVLKCIKCNEVYEPNVLYGPRDIAYKEYENFLDQMRTQEEKGENV